MTPEKHGAPIPPRPRDPGPLDLTGLGRSLREGAHQVAETISVGLAWVDEHRDDISRFWDATKRRGGEDDPWRYLLEQTDALTSIGMRAGLVLEGRVRRKVRGDVLVELLEEGLTEPDLLTRIQTELEEALTTVVRREQLSKGISFVADRQYHLAVPLLINATEGLFWEAASEAGLIEKNARGKWHCTPLTDSPGKQVHGLEQVLSMAELNLAPSYRDFLRAVVYGGAGDPFRHGTAEDGWKLRALFLTVALIGWLDSRGQLNSREVITTALREVDERRRSSSETSGLAS